MDISKSVHGRMIKHRRQQQQAGKKYIAWCSRETNSLATVFITLLLLIHLAKNFYDSSFYLFSTIKHLDQT